MAAFGKPRIRGNCLLTWENDGCEASRSRQMREALSVSRVSRALDRIVVSFDDPNLVANAGLLRADVVIVYDPAAHEGLPERSQATL